MIKQLDHRKGSSDVQQSACCSEPRALSCVHPASVLSTKRPGTFAVHLILAAPPTLQSCSAPPQPSHQLMLKRSGYCLQEKYSWKIPRLVAKSPFGGELLVWVIPSLRASHTRLH